MSSVTAKSTQAGFRRLLEPWLVSIFLALQSALVLSIALKQSVTFDETGHLVAGVAHWRYGDFSLYAVNPPLSRMAATLPALPFASDFEFPRYNAYPERREEMRLGVLFSTMSDEYHLFTVVARLALLPFCWLGGFVCYVWAKELYGFRAGLVALLLWCLSPSILANASQVLPDLAVTTLFVTTCFLLRKRVWTGMLNSSFIAGGMLGAAMLCKFTAVLLFPIVLAVSIYEAVRTVEESVLSRVWLAIGRVFTICCACLFVINLGYFFEDTLLPLREFEFLSESFSGIEKSENMKGNRFLSELTSQLPVPVPRNYLLGVDLAKFELERGYWSYLNGEFSTTGWWYFYLYGLAMKEPIGGLGLLVIAGASWVCRAMSRKLLSGEVLLVCVPILLLAVLSLETGYTHHVRYALPVLPFAYILASRSFATPWLMKAQWALVFWFVASSLLCFPHQISYFNELAGGPSNGWKHLNTSNFDWGQDLIYLQKWARENPEKKPLYVKSSGAVPPHVYGIECQEVAPEVSADGVFFPAGWYAISVGEMLKVKSSVLPFWDRTPADRVAHTIFIYHLESPFAPTAELRED